MREEKNVRIKNDGSQIFRLPVKKISGFLGSVMFLSCLAFPLPTFAEEALFTEEAASGNKKSEEKETLIYESPIFTDGGEAFIPEETRSEGEKEYRLVSKRIRNAKKAGEITYAQVTIPYDLEGDDTVPETADVPLIDEESGTEFERELSLVDVEETSRSWSDTFSFSVTVSGYGADSFYLGDMEIPGDADLADYGEKLLELAGLSRVYYRVDRVEWDGEPYMDGEVMFRNATAGGSKLIRNVKAKYGGQNTGSERKAVYWNL